MKFSDFLICCPSQCRLTFWLSNSVVLRAIVSQAFEEQQLPLSAGPFAERAGNREGNTEKSSLLKWKDSSSSTETISALHESFDDWEDPHTFTSALEKIESWIFSRIVESVWWQVVTFFYLFFFYANESL